MPRLPSSTEARVSNLQSGTSTPSTHVHVGQLQKAGIIQSAKTPQATPASAKRRSGQLDFSKLGPLKTGGTVGFSTFRDQTTDASHRRKARKKSNGNIADDSDEDDDDDEGPAVTKMEDTDDKVDVGKLAPEDARFQGELADGVNRIHVSHHINDPLLPYTDGLLSSNEHIPPTPIRRQQLQRRHCSLLHLSPRRTRPQQAPRRRARQPRTWLRTYRRKLLLAAR